MTLTRGPLIVNVSGHYRIEEVEIDQLCRGKANVMLKL